MGYATPPTCSSGWRYFGEPATLAGRHAAAYVFQNFPSPLLQLFVVVEPEHSGEGRFHHVRLGGAVVETVHFYLFLEGSGVAMTLCRVSLGRARRCSWQDAAVSTATHRGSNLFSGDFLLFAKRRHF